MSSDDENKAKAAQLKAEGNALHVKGNHAEARLKYTEAIKHDGENAVLYANRAASYIALKQYLDAGHDAEKAVELDPTYGKAWARLAKATAELHVFPRSVNAWKKALGTLPSANLTAQQQQFKRQYEDGLKEVEAEWEKWKQGPEEVGESRVRALPAKDDLPWHRALKMEHTLTVNNVLNTSAWAIMNAYRDFSEGVRYMRQLERTDEGISGNLNAVTDIMGGILRDERVFHMDSEDWIEKLQLQANKGWDTGGPDTVKEEVVQRLKEQGWKPTRLALAATIRAWFLRAYFADRSGDSKALALQYYNNVIDVLEWGARTWHDVPSSDKGYIFQKTFIRAIKKFRMETYLDALRQSSDKSEDSECNVDDLIDMAKQMVEETNKNIPNEGDEDAQLDKGAWYSFFVYPIAEAHATLGAVFLQQGLSAKQANEAEQAENMLAAAANFYKKAAETYPPDDENFPFYLKIAFEAEYHRGRPLSETLALCARVRRSLPGVLKIWGGSSSNKLGHHIRELDVFEERAYTGLLDKDYTMETPSSQIPLN
ncbi:TPR-like protein [Trametes meyenii]|nr:TPR-like protein [Trametes meyenii]